MDDFKNKTRLPEGKPSDELLVTPVVANASDL